MSDFFTTTFTSYDAPDEKNIRAEVFVIVGKGTVDEIEPSKAGSSFNVKFDTGNKNGYKTAGWIPGDEKAFEIIKEASENGEPLEFRVELTRKKGKDRTLTMNELRGIGEDGRGDMGKSKDNINRNLVAVKREDDEEWITQKYIRTNMAEDPQGGNGIYSAANIPVEQLRGATPTGNSTPQSNAFEPAPYITYNSRGEINPGSTAVSVPLNVYFYIVKYVEEHGLLTNLDEDEKKAEAKRKKIIRSLTARVVDMANKLQLKIYEGELHKPDLSLGSHTRARHLLFEVIRHFYPITDEVLTDSANFKKWEKDVLKMSNMMWAWSIEEVKKIEENEE